MRYSNIILHKPFKENTKSLDLNTKKYLALSKAVSNNV